MRLYEILDGDSTLTDELEPMNFSPEEIFDYEQTSNGFRCYGDFKVQGLEVIDSVLYILTEDIFENLPVGYLKIHFIGDNNIYSARYQVRFDSEELKNLKKFLLT